MIILIWSELWKNWRYLWLSFEWNLGRRVFDYWIKVSRNIKWAFISLNFPRYWESNRYFLLSLGRFISHQYALSFTFLWCDRYSLWYNFQRWFDDTILSYIDRNLWIIYIVKDTPIFSVWLYDHIQQFYSKIYP